MLGTTCLRVSVCSLFQRPSQYSAAGDFDAVFVVFAFRNALISDSFARRLTRRPQALHNPHCLSHSQDLRRKRHSSFCPLANHHSVERLTTLVDYGIRRLRDEYCGSFTFSAALIRRPLALIIRRHHALFTYPFSSSRYRRVPVPLHIHMDFRTPAGLAPTCTPRY